MEKIRTLSLPVCLFALGITAFVVIGAAIYINGDVKATVKMLGIEFMIDTKDRPTP